MQTDANVGYIWVWRYPEEAFLEDCMQGTVISGFRKVKVWGAMRYGCLSKLVVIPEGEGDGKMNAKEYCDSMPRRLQAVIAVKGGTTKY